jgi:hypothetical protein
MPCQALRARELPMGFDLLNRKHNKRGRVTCFPLRGSPPHELLARLPASSLFHKCQEDGPQVLGRDPTAHSGNVRVIEIYSLVVNERGTTVLHTPVDGQDKR